MKKLKDNEIKKVKKSLKSKIDKSIFQITADNIENTNSILESKMNLDSWSEQDKQEVIQSFKEGCSATGNQVCILVIKEFNKLFKYSEYKAAEYCKCCLLYLHCSNHPKNKTEDNWHYNATLIWKNVVKGPFDLDYIKDRWNKMINSDSLQNYIMLLRNIK